MNRRTILLLSATTLLALASAICYLCARPHTTKESIPIYPDAYSREYYLNLCGWEVTLLQSKEVQIPQQFNETYRAYCRLQEKQGLPLRDYKGETAVLYTYEVHNYGGNDPIRAELLLCDHVLIGASLYSLSQNGFQCGLRGETLI